MTGIRTLFRPSTHVAQRTQTARLFAGMAAFALLALAFAVHAAVYKTTDAEGNVVYTDVPPKAGQGEPQQPLELPAGNVYAPTVSTPPPPPPGEEEEPEETSTHYDTLSITAPAQDTAVRENAGNVTVYTRVEPALREGHEVRMLLDGVPWPVRSKGAIAMTNIDRGTHSLTAQVVDANDQVLISSDPVTFHMLRISVITRPRGPSVNP